MFINTKKIIVFLIIFACNGSYAGGIPKWWEDYSPPTKTAPFLLNSFADYKMALEDTARDVTARELYIHYLSDEYAQLRLNPMHEELTYHLRFKYFDDVRLAFQGLAADYKQIDQFLGIIENAETNHDESETSQSLVTPEIANFLSNVTFWRSNSLRLAEFFTSQRDELWVERQWWNSRIAKLHGDSMQVRDMNDQIIEILKPKYRDGLYNAYAVIEATKQLCGLFLTKAEPANE